MERADTACAVALHGVLYAALDAGSLRLAQRARLAVASALRSGSYTTLGPVPGAVTVDVVSDDGRGRRRTVSHHNKSHKGRLARLLATAPREVSGAADVARIGQRGGLQVYRTGEHELEPPPRSSRRPAVTTSANRRRRPSSESALRTALAGIIDAAPVAGVFTTEDPFPIQLDLTALGR